MEKKSYSLAELAEIVGAQLDGNPDCKVDSLASLERAKEGQISFLVSSRYQLVASSRHERHLPTTCASAVLLSPYHSHLCSVNKLIVDDPYQGYVKLATLFERKPPRLLGIHPTAIIGKNCHIARSAYIGPHCVVGDDCLIGERTLIEANSVVYDSTHIGADCFISTNVAIYHAVHIGNRVVIHAGAVIGGQGFGMIRTKEGWKTVPHLGTVLIGDDVEIGANTTIDRGSVDDTVIEKGVKLDNLIQVAHGVVIGENTVIAACTGIAGSTRIGKNCMVGGATGFADNIVICDNVIFSGMSQVTKSISKPGVYSSGTSIMPQKAWHKNIARLHNLDDMARKQKKLERNQNE